MDERDAIARLQRGDIGGLEALVRAYQVRAVRTAYLVTRDLALADDIMQAAFLKVVERIDQFDARRPFGPWFLKLVLNDALKAAAWRERHRPLAAGLDGDAGADADRLTDEQPGPEALVERAETAAEVWAALGQLPAAQRAAIVQRYFLGLSEAEMVAVQGCAPSTVKWRLRTARERLRVLLRPTLAEGEGSR